MGHKHLTTDKREILERLFNQGHSIRSAARILGYSASAICQEKQRAKAPSAKRTYRADEAQRRAEYRRNNAYRKRCGYSAELIDFIQQGLRARWSPEQISGRLCREFPDDPRMRIGYKTIYRWLDKAARSSKPAPWRPYVRFLRHKRRGKSFGHGKSDRRGARSDLPSIESRSAEVAARSRFGDWECDLIQGHNRQGYLVTLLERSTGLLLAHPCRSKRMQVVNQAIFAAFRAVTREAVRTITFDRGKEFYGFRELERRLGVDAYFCHPNCPGERGQNEQANGLLRQFFPKRKSLSEVSRKEVNRAVALINNRPKKKLGYATTMELLAERGLNGVFSLT